MQAMIKNATKSEVNHMGMEYIPQKKGAILPQKDVLMMVYITIDATGRKIIREIRWSFFVPIEKHIRNVNETPICLIASQLILLFVPAISDFLDNE